MGSWREWRGNNGGMPQGMMGLSRHAQTRVCVCIVCLCVCVCVCDCVCGVCARVRVCACVRVCVCGVYLFVTVCVHACVRACQCTGHVHVYTHIYTCRWPALFHYVNIQISHLLGRQGMTLLKVTFYFTFILANEIFILLYLLMILLLCLQ